VAKNSFSMAVIAGAFVAAALCLFTAQPAQAQGCYYTAQADYICDSPPAPGQPIPPPSTAPTAPTTPAPNTPPYVASDVACKSDGGSNDGYEAFKRHLLVREGKRNVVYRDSLGKPTVGVGHLVLPGDNLKVGDTITDAQVQAFLDQDAQAAWAAANRQAAEAGVTDGCFTVALASVNFQLGTGWTKKFPNTWALIKAGKYNEAATELSGSLWAKQTPVRVQDFQKALRDLAARKAAGGGAAPATGP